MLPDSYSPAPDLLAHRVILITGAGDGLGRAAALAAARHGATVVLLGKTVRKLETVYDAIEQAGGSRPGIYPLNLAGASWNDYAALAETLEREFGRLDGIVHCAAHFKQFSRFQDVDPKDWLESLQVNLTAAFALTSQCLPLLERSADASVVFVSDVGGREARPFQGAYGVAKAGVENLCRSWALELEHQPQLRFNSFYPGPMRTTIRLKGYPGESRETLPSPEAAAQRLLWLLGPDSRGVSGQTF